jgi:hypothetical protein
MTNYFDAIMYIGASRGSINMISAAEFEAETEEMECQMKNE